MIEITLWLVVALNLVNIPLSINMIGKPRKPLTSSGATTLVVFSLIYAGLAGASLMEL